MSGLSDAIQQSKWRASQDLIPHEGGPSDTGNIVHYVPAHSGHGKGKGNGLDWQRILGVMRREWPWSVAFAILVIAGVTLAVFVMKPTYEPTARIEVDPPGAETFSLGVESSADPADYLETQAKILQSDELAIQVIRKLRLDQNPYFVAAAPSIARVATLARPSANQQMEPGLTAAEDRALG